MYIKYRVFEEGQGWVEQVTKTSLIEVSAGFMHFVDEDLHMPCATHISDITSISDTII